MKTDLNSCYEGHLSLRAQLENRNFLSSMLCRKEREKAAWVEPGWTWLSSCFYNTHTSINECSGSETLYYENRPSAKQNTSINHSGGTFAALWQNPLLRSCFLSWTRLCPRSTREIVKDDLLPQVPLTSSKDLTALQLFSLQHPLPLASLRWSW